MFDENVCFANNLASAVERKDRNDVFVDLEIIVS